MNEQPVFIGIDTTAGVRPAKVAVLDANLHVRRVDSLPLDTIVSLVNQYPHVVCGIDAPVSASRSLLSDPTTRERYGLDPKKKGYASHRLCEFELRRRGIHSYKTPADPDRAPSWMKASWQLYDRLRSIGFVVHPNKGQRVMFETYPHAAYTALIKKRPYQKDSLEGRIQRQLILYREGVEVRDDMEVFEEWTRHHFMIGEVPMKGLYNHDELDALIAAYTAFVLYREPQNITSLGDPSEGQILIPVPDAVFQTAYA